MWVAYGLAPAICPTAFVGIVIFAWLASEYAGSTFNLAAVVVLPVLALTAGTVASYLVAGLVGMPVAFMLRRMRALNFITIHAAAFVWACLFSWLSIFLVSGDGVPPGHRLSWFGETLLWASPPILLSALVFWLILRLPAPRVMGNGFEVICRQAGET